MAAFRLTSPAFEHDDELPFRFTSDGDDVSPPLAWSNVPEGTRELILVCDDPDGETGVVTHWIAYGMDPSVDGLPEGLPRSALVEDPVSLVQGRNEFDEVGYSGPVADSQRGAHRCFFRLFAVDRELDLAPGIDRAELRHAAKDHIIATAVLVGIV